MSLSTVSRVTGYSEGEFQYPFTVAILRSGLPDNHIATLALN